MAPLVLFEKSRLWAGTGFHLLPSFHHHPTQHNYTYSHPNLNFLQYTIQLLRPTRNVVCPSGAWFENRPHSTPSICPMWNPKRVIVQWVGFGTHTRLFEVLLWWHWQTVCYSRLSEYEPINWKFFHSKHLTLEKTLQIKLSWVIHSMLVISETKHSHFYFWATLGVKEVLQSTKNLTLIFLWFLILHHSHSLKMCFRKKCLCVFVCPSSIAEPKPIDRSHSNLISRVLL